MLVALQYQANPRKYTVEDVNIHYQPEILKIYRRPVLPPIDPETGNQVAHVPAALIETFRCTYTGLRYKGKMLPIYEQII